MSNIAWFRAEGARAADHIELIRINEQYLTSAYHYNNQRREGTMDSQYLLQSIGYNINSTNNDMSPNSMTMSLNLRIGWYRLWCNISWTTYRR